MHLDDQECQQEGQESRRPTKARAVHLQTLRVRAGEAGGGEARTPAAPEPPVPPTE